MQGGRSATPLLGLPLGWYCMVVVVVVDEGMSRNEWLGVDRRQRGASCRYGTRDAWMIGMNATDSSSHAPLRIA